MLHIYSNYYIVNLEHFPLSVSNTEKVAYPMSVKRAVC